MVLKVLVVHGPNLNLLGTREKEIYGLESLERINESIIEWGSSNNVEIDIFHSNHEGEIIDRLHNAINVSNYIVLNPGALTHYSYALRDAITAINIPVIEIHLSNIFSREDFRSKTITTPSCTGMICGFGKESYILGLVAGKNILRNKKL